MSIVKFNNQSSASTVESTEPKTMVQSRLVFYVSRYKSTKQGQIRLGEYGGMGDDGVVKALATLHMKHSFLSGMPAAFVTPAGTHWSIDRTDDAGFMSLQLNFSPAQLQGLEKQLTEEIKGIWSNPPKDANFKSELRGYQIHVILKAGAMARIQLENNDYKQGKENLILDPSEIEAVEIVTAESEYYARRGHQVEFDAFVETFFKPADENVAKTKEDVKALLSRLHKDADEGKNVKNRYRRGNKAAQAGANEATKVTTSEEMS